MTIPQVELHVHLEGTITPALAHQLAQRNRLALDKNRIQSDGESYRFDGFLDFLQAYDHIAALIKQPRDYYDLTSDYLRRTAEGGCIYTEMMYSPDHAEQATSIPSREHLAAIAEAIKHAEEKYGILGRILITAVRHFADCAHLLICIMKPILYSLIFVR